MTGYDLEKNEIEKRDYHKISMNLKILAVALSIGQQSVNVFFTKAHFESFHER